jgi:DegV family protein with EDD domain
MQIVTDGGVDFAPNLAESVSISSSPLILSLSGKDYKSGVDIQPLAFYKLLSETNDFPLTSTPSPGDFEALYKQVMQKDKDILSIHMSSGLSGTFNAARTAASMVSGANITMVDTQTLSGGSGWQIEAAVRGIKAGWDTARIIDLMKQIHAVTDSIFTLNILKYLVHGGRISHMQGMFASVLDIKPLIGVSKADGKYDQRGRVRTFNGAINKIAETIATQHGEGVGLRAQIIHGNNPEGVEKLKERLDQLFKCQHLPTIQLSPALGAHTGPSVVGVHFARLDQYPVLP